MNKGLKIHQRLAAVMGEVSYIQKEAKRGMQYTIVSHDAVTAKVRPALLEHGVVYHPVNLSHEQIGNRTQVALTVRFVNIDNSEDYIDVPSLGYGIDQQDKGPGKAISYAVKYALLKALGLETGDDAENENIDHGADPQDKVVDLEAEKRANSIAIDKMNLMDSITTLDELGAFWTELNKSHREVAGRTDVIAKKDEVKRRLSGQQEAG